MKIISCVVTMTVFILLPSISAKFMGKTLEYECSKHDRPYLNLGDTLYVSTPNFGHGNYHNNIRCSIDVRVNEKQVKYGVRMKAEFVSLDIQYTNPCSTDWLVVSVSGKSGRICGSNVKEINDFFPKQLLQVYLNFRSDNMYTGMGFKLRIEAYSTYRGR
ncbi:Uncharacterised protein g2478 [Pycnogonum litorale]